MDTFDDIPNFSPRPGQPLTVTVTTRWKRREWGGWNLVEARTGRLLGWIVRDLDDPKLWVYRICSSAFRGDGPDDRGDIMDKVPAYLYHGSYTNDGTSRALGASRSRWGAAHGIVWNLVQYHAPAVGFGRHGEVEMSRWNPKSPTFDSLLVGAL